MLTVYCPSRGRPAEAHAVLASFRDTKTTDESEVVFLVDSDDPTLSEYPEPRIVGDPVGNPTGPLNDAVRHSRSSIVGFMGDDSRFQTTGWDRMVLEALREPGICYGWEGHDKPWPSTVFISSQITSALGYMVPRELQRGYFDVAWIVLAQLSGTERILTDMVIPHDNSNGHVDPAIIAADERAFRKWQETESRTDAQRIRHAIYR